MSDRKSGDPHTHTDEVMVTSLVPTQVVVVVCVCVCGRLKVCISLTQVWVVLWSGKEIGMVKEGGRGRDHLWEEKERGRGREGERKTLCGRRARERGGEGERRPSCGRRDRVGGRRGRGGPFVEGEQ